MDDSTVLSMIKAALPDDDGQTVDVTKIASSLDEYKTTDEEEEGDEEADDEDLKVLLSILKKSKVETAKRLKEEQRKFNESRAKENERRRQELEKEAFHANAQDFVHVLRGPMHVRRVDDLQGHTDCFLVSRSCSSSTGEFVACWTNDQLYIHPWNTDTISDRFPVSHVTSKGRFNVINDWSRGSNHGRFGAVQNAQYAMANARHGPSPIMDATNNVNTPIPPPGLQTKLAPSFGGFRRKLPQGALSLPPASPAK